MDSTLDMINPADFGALMAQTRQDPRAAACSEAFFFLSVFRDVGAARPDVAATQALIQALTDHAVLMLSLDDLSRIRGVTALNAAPEEGAFVVFEDFSVLCFDAKGLLCDTEINPDLPEDISFGQELPNGMTLPILATSPGYISRYGAPQPTEGEASGAAEAYIDDIFETMHDLIDPPVDFSDAIATQKSWSDTQVEELADLTTLIWLGIGADFEAEVEILSASDEFDYDVSLRVEDPIDASHKQTMQYRFLTCLEGLHDLSRYQGWELVTNDKAYERMSGYDKTSITVMWRKLDPASPDISNHYRINARESLRSLLDKNGMSQEQIATLTNPTSHD